MPKQFGTTRHSGDYDLVQVLDKEAIFAIALPVYGYLSASANGTPTNRFFMGKLGKFFDLNNVTYDQAKANDEAYFKKWPNRVNSIDSKNIVVEKVNWSGSTCYFVTMPYSWSVRNGNKSQNGKAVAVAYVMPGHHTGNGKSDYFITSIWNDGKQ